MSAHRTRGILRAAALLAVGASPLMAGAASAAEQPLELAEGKLGDAPKVDHDVTRPVTDLLDGKTLKLPVSLPEASAALETPKLPVETPATEGVEGEERAFTNGIALPAAPQAITPPEIKLPQIQQPAIPAVPRVPEVPNVGQPPVDAPDAG